MKVGFLKQEFIKGGFLSPEHVCSNTILIEAAIRGHEIYHLHPDKIIFNNNSVACVADVLDLNPDSQAVQVVRTLKTDLTDLDVIFVRMDGFDINYITQMTLLSLISDDVLIINDPFWVKNFYEKLYPFFMTDACFPKTLITHDKEMKIDFIKQNGKAVLKPLYAYGGDGVLLMDASDVNLNALLEVHEKTFDGPSILQEYLPASEDGDKRIFIIDGEPLGAVLRKSNQDFRKNIKRGGSVHFVDLSEQDKEICDFIIPKLQEKNIMICGLDVIGDKVTEINVTSPVGFSLLEDLGNINAKSILWDKVEKKLS